MVYLCPWEERSEAFPLGVHLILLYFIRISLSTPEIFFLFGCWCGCGCWCWWRTFFLFKFFHNKMIYSSYITMYIYKRNPCRTKVLWVLKFGEVGGRDFFFKITAGRTVFNFSCKTSCFELVFSLFE